MRSISTAGLFLLCSCGLQMAKESEPLKQTYVHKYGLEVDQKGWQSRGECGQVVTVRKDGVTVTESWDEGQRHGTTTYSYPHSTAIARVETFERGKLASVAKHYENGMPSVQTDYLADDERHVTAWYDDGTPRSSELYNGQHLAWGEYYTPLNVADSWVIDGEGLRLQRDADGVIEAEEIVSGGRVTKCTTYLASGEPAAITHMRNGKRHGQRRTYLEGGLPHTIERWKDGQLDGEVITFSNGQKRSVTPYIRGIKEGVEKIFDSHGLVVEEITWSEGDKHGPVTYFVDNTPRVDWYHHNHIVSRHTYEKLNPRET